MLFIKYLMPKQAIVQQSSAVKALPLLMACLKTLLAIAVLGLGNILHADVRVAHSSLVSENPSPLTPSVVDGRVEAIAIDGDTVFVGGTFSQIRAPGSNAIISQPYLFAYSKSTGAIIRNFDPVLDNAVRALHSTGEGRGVFVGGIFTSVNGEDNIRGLVKLNNFGNRVPSFLARIDKRVNTMDRSGDKLYIGGNFETVNDQPREFLAVLDTQTGTVLPNVNLDFEGAFSTDDVNGFPSVDIIEVSSDDQLMVMVGNFRSINGSSRSRLAVLELGNQARVSAWNTDVYDTQCPVSRFPQYIEGLDMAPDDSYFLVGTKGGHLRLNPACHTILRFNLDDLDDSDAQPAWRTFTGGDSVYEVAAADHVVYVGGHFRWLNNGVTIPGDEAGPGSIARRGLAALDPRNGLPIVDWRSDRNPRGIGIFALEIQPEGLYIGDDTEFLNGVARPRLKFLPISNDRIQRPGVASLPTSTVSVEANSLLAEAFDGDSFGSASVLSNTGWSNTRGAMFLDRQLFHADNTGKLWVSPLMQNNTMGNRTPVDLRGLTQSNWNLSQLGGMFFDHAQGRIYYTLENDSRLRWRAFTPEGPIVGDFAYIAEEQGDILWNDVRGMDVIDGYLYFGRSDGVLYRSEINGAAPVSGSTVAVSGPGIDDQIWNDPFLAFSAAATSDAPAPESPGAFDFEFDFEASADFRSFRRFEFAVAAGEAIDVQLRWDNPDALLNVFLLDENGDLLDADVSSNGTSPKNLSAPSGNGGLYTVAVKIKQGSTAYTVGINTGSELADIEFNSSGNENSGRWQVFRFEVDAGDLIEAQVAWDNPAAALRFFLRDESNAQIDRDTDNSGSPGIVSAVAQTSGTWSVGVAIVSGSANYDVSVGITR